GNEHKVSIKNFFTETGHQCKVCTQIRREKEGHPLQISLDNINKEIKPYNFKIIKNEKNLSFGKSTLICPKGHKNKMVWLVLKQKIELITEDKHKIETICNKCKELKIFEEKKEYVLKKGFILDCEFNQWKGIRNKYKFICINNQNHIRKTRISSFSKTNQCKECTDEKREKDNFDKFKTLVEKRGGKVKEDINRITKERRVKCRCTYNHDFEISYEKLSINQWCRACVIGISENIVRIIFEHIYKELFPNVRPNFLKSPHSDYNLELDGYNEELELAFEYQGPHHYNNPMVQERDKFKLLQTKEKDITLVIIPEFTPSNNNNDYIDHIVKYLKENNVDIPQFSREIDFSSAFKGSTTHNKFKNILEEHKGEIMPSIENPNAQYKGVGTQLLLSCTNKEHKPFILTPNAIIYYNSWCKLCKKEMK
ncbi:MAG: hypothetical protein U9P38_05695, partial [Campylobacterota bacterium]|nr:hypothetical protein [Campylobacterota bacterium]